MFHMNKKRWLLAAALAFLVAFIVFGLKSNAEADSSFNTNENSVGCVSDREWNLYNTALPKRDLERRWEVTGLGMRVSTLFGNGVAYPRCGLEKLFPSSSMVVQYEPDDGRLYGTSVFKY